MISYFRGALDCARAERELGFSPKYDLHEGLRDVVEWYKKNPDFRIFDGKSASPLE
jgi:nucleoside-diphosphate-sugar epimerase